MTVYQLWHNTVLVTEGSLRDCWKVAVSKYPQVDEATQKRENIRIMPKNAA